MRAHEHQFIEGFDRHADELFRHAALRLKDRERARDLTQDAFMKTWQFMEGGGEVRELRAFLFRTLKNLIIDEYRRSKTESLESLVDTDEGETIDALLPPDETNTLESAIARLDGAQALAAIKELPADYAETLLFRYVDGLAPSEIAVMMQVTENVVSVRIHRGLKKLKDLLDTTP